MGRVLLDITISLDGFVTGPGADLSHGLGIGGDPLHDWLAGEAEADRVAFERTSADIGAVLMGRRTFDFVDGPQGWNADGFGDERPPIYVVTSNPPSRVRLDGWFEFVPDGIEPALKLAQTAAGTRDVMIMGGGHLCRQYLYAGLVDELRVHVAPIVLGDGTPLFERTTLTPIQLVPRETTSTSNATHLTYDVPHREQ